MMNFVKFGGDLIWRMGDFDKFGGDLIWQNSPNSPNLIPAKINPLKVVNITLKEYYTLNEKKNPD